MSSSIRKATPRRTHRERAQPLAREKLGLLEKHKDYVLRARDFHSKEKRLKVLHEKASHRNEDEFYFGMIRSTMKDGIHIKERNDTFSHEFLSLLKTQDQNYIVNQRNINEKKIESLQSFIHIIDDSTSSSVTTAEETGKVVIPQAKHTIFVDDEQSVKTFDAAKHFNTHESLLSRRFNRPTLETLATSNVAEMASTSAIATTRKEVKRMEKKRAMSLVELSSRLDRSRELRKAEIELNIQRALMGKGRRAKIGVDANGLPMYKWKPDRKR